MRRQKNRRLVRRYSGRGAEEAPGYALADKIYDLSLALGELRARSIVNVGALRSLAQGVPELDEAFRPLLEALEAGLAECHQADLEAIFGRPEPVRDMLESPPPPQIGRGFGRVRGGGAEAAAQRLATALSVFGLDVEAAGMLVKDGANLRSVVRWIRRGRTTAQAPRADRTFEGGTLSKKRAAPDADGAGTKSESGAANVYGAAERDACKNWTLRIFREPTALLESTCAVDDGSDGGSGGGRSSSATYHAGNTGSDANTTDSGNRDGSGVCLSRFGTNSEEQGGRGPPLLVVNALRVPLPPVPAVPTAAVAEGARLTAPRRGGPSGAGSAPALRSEWRNPFSWLAGYYWRSDGEECRDLEPALSMPPPPPLVPPRVIVRVVYVGRAPDVARFAREVERLGEVQDCAAATAATAVATGAAGCPDAGASLAAGDGHVTQPSDVEGATVDGATPRTAEGSATVVELVRSEVRVRRACVPAKAARENPERGCTEGADADSGLVPRSATQLQIVFELRTRAPVIVSRVLHTGGGVLPHPHLRRSLATPPSVPRESSVQSAISSPGLASSFHPPSAIASGNNAPGDLADQVGCSDRGGSDTGLGGGGGGGVGFGAGVGCINGGVMVGAGGASSEGVGGRAVEDGGDQGGGSLNGVCRGQGCGIRGADEVDEIIPSGWVEAPSELSLPGDTAEQGSKLKVGTSHVLGMNVPLPELPSVTLSPSPPPSSESQPSPPLQHTEFREETRASTPRGGVSPSGGAHAETPPKSKKRKSSFEGTRGDQQQAHSGQVDRQGEARPRPRKRSRFGNGSGALVPVTGVGRRAHDTRGSGDGGGSGGGNGGGGGDSDGGSGGGGIFARYENENDSGGAREVKKERKTWWGWRFTSLWGRQNGDGKLLPDTSPARQQQQQRPQQSRQTQEYSLSGTNDVQASGSTTEDRLHGVYCDTDTGWLNGAAGRRGAMDGVGPPPESGAPRESSGSHLLSRSPLVITVVLAPSVVMPE